MQNNHHCKRSFLKGKTLKYMLQALIIGCFVVVSGVSNAQAKVWQVGNEAQLRNAMTGAQAGDTIQITKNIVVTSPLPALSGDGINIEGKLGSINLNGNSIYVTGNVGSLQNVNLQGGNSFFGGAVFVGNDLTGGINNSTFTNNKAGTGGAVYVQNDLTDGINNSTFSNNTAGNSGGAVHVENDLTDGINNSTFSNNTATSFAGGAVFVQHDLTGGINNSTFSNNTAGNSGGAVYVENDLTGGINNSTFTNNTTGVFDYGGAVYVYNSLTGGINNSTFTNNEAGTGGAVNVNNLTGGINNSTFSNNTATTGNGGGAVYVEKDLTGGINNSTFSNNTATTGNGGAVFVGKDLTGGINNSTFTNNEAGTGGAMYVENSMDIVVNKGATTLFYNNTDSSGKNSMYFNNGISGESIKLNIEGALLVYDPITGGNIALTKTGSGLLLLGGNSNLGSGDWNIEAGTLLLTYDSANSAGEINGTGNFNLGSGAVLQIVPTIEANTAVKINAGTITLEGKTTVGSDYRYLDRQTNIIGTDKELLVLNSAYSGAGQLSNSSGRFALGQYDYEYDNLHWDLTKTELLFNVNRSYLNPERTGGYTADGAMRTRLANNTSNLVFGQMQNDFESIQSSAATGQKNALHKNLWGTYFQGHTHNESDGIYATSRTKVPGFVVGAKLLQGESYFNGLAISLAYPDYRQGNIKSDGQDFRLALYGGKLFDKEIEFSYLVSAGVGDMSQKRQAGGDRLRAEYDVNSYSVGVGVGKEIYKSKMNKIKPFITYEYIKIKSDGYSEKGSILSGITTSDIKQDISRVKMGVALSTQYKKKNSLNYSVYYEGLFGDTAPDVSSYMTNTVNSRVKISGGGMDKNALGFSLGYNRKVSDQIDAELSYNGLVGSKSMSNDFKVKLNYNF